MFAADSANMNKFSVQNGFAKDSLLQDNLFFEKSNSFLKRFFRSGYYLSNLKFQKIGMNIGNDERLSDSDAQMSTRALSKAANSSHYIFDESNAGEMKYDYIMKSVDRDDQF